MPRGINTINGIDYVYEYKSNWNPALKRSEQKREYIGKIVDGAFVPNKTYRMRLELEALKKKEGIAVETEQIPIEEELPTLLEKKEEAAKRAEERKAEKKRTRGAKGRKAGQKRKMKAKAAIASGESTEKASDTVADEGKEFAGTPQENPAVPPIVSSSAGIDSPEPASSDGASTSDDEGPELFVVSPEVGTTSRNSSEDTSARNDSAAGPSKAEEKTHGKPKKNQRKEKTHSDEDDGQLLLF